MKIILYLILILNITFAQDNSKKFEFLFGKEYRASLGGYQFDGVDDFVSVANNANLNFGTGDFSIEWQGVWQSGVIYFANKRSGSAGYQIYLFSNQFNLYLQGASTRVLNYSLVSGASYHINISIQRSSIATIYVNGSSVGTIDVSMDAANIISTTALLAFGSNLSGTFTTGNYYLSRLYNKALSQSEVTSLYNGQRITDGLVAEYLPSNAGRIGWVETVNKLHGQTSGSPLSNNVTDRVNYQDVKTLVTGNTTLTNIVPENYFLREIRIENNTANVFTMNISGVSSGGTDIATTSVAASSTTTLQVNKSFYAQTTIYLQSSNWNSSSSSVYFVFEPL
jgi:hypothetical protein